MIKNKLFALFFSAAAFALAAEAAGTAAALAGDGSASMESIFEAVAADVTDAAQTPTEVFTGVTSARGTWTSIQIAGLYRSILNASPALLGSFVDDVKAFNKAGKPSVVSADAPEGVKLLAALYGLKLSGVDADAVLASVAADATGTFATLSVSPTRDAKAASAPVRRPQPTKPTPPAASCEN